MDAQDRNYQIKDCFYPWTWLVIGYEGSIKPCCWAKGSVGHLSDGIDSLWNNRLFGELRESITNNQLHPICTGAPCPYVKGSLHIEPNQMSEEYSRRVYLFDEKYYLSNNEDVREAIIKNKIDSSEIHYNQYGAFENRKARYQEFIINEDFIKCFDEVWYHEKYPDVSIAVNRGELSCALEHYLMHGQHEKRMFRLLKESIGLNNYQNSLIEFINNNKEISSKPTIITLEAMTKCNLKCVICPQSRSNIDEPDYPSEDYLDYVKPYLDSQTRIQIAGIGEPLLSPLFWKFIEYLKEVPEIHARMNSNGTLWSEKNINKILKSNLAEISFSIDAATPETYYKIRGANFNKVINNITHLIKEKNNRNKTNPLIYLNMTLMKENIEEVVRFIELAKEMEVDRVKLWHLDPFLDDKEEWIIGKKNWIFNYKEQMLSNYPELSNRNINMAIQRANDLKIDLSFIDDRDITF